MRSTKHLHEEVICLLLLLSIAQLEAARILFVNTWHSKSHAKTMMGLAERLVQRGLDVTMYTPAFSELGPMGNGVKTLYSVVSTEAVDYDMQRLGELFWNLEMSPLLYTWPSSISRDFLVHSVNSSALSEVLSTPYDLVFLDELFSPFQAAVALALRARHASRLSIFSTTIMYDVMAREHGFARMPTLAENIYIRGDRPTFDPLSFFDRLKNLVDALLEMPTFLAADFISYQPAGEVLGLPHVTMHSFYQEVEFTFSDYPRGMRLPLPIGNAQVRIGENCNDAKELPEDLREFIEDPESAGTIYVAFGSIVRWDTGPKDAPATFLHAFEHFRSYRVIWAYGGPALPEHGSHIRLLKWAPQDAILTHPKTVLFFTHAGIKSLKEGICGGVPLLVMPFFADQMLNAAACRRLGMALTIYKQNITEPELFSKMSAILYNEEFFKLNVKKYKSEFTDRVMPSLMEGVFRAERILRTPPGAYDRFIRIRGSKLGWLPFLMVDLALSVLAAVAILSL